MRVGRACPGSLARFYLDGPGEVASMLDRMLVPEFLQENCTPDNLARAVARLLDDPAARQEQIDGVAEVARWLGEGGRPPSEQAADVVLSIIAGKTRRPA